MIEAKIKVMPLANITGTLLLKIPYSNHKKVPAVKTPYIASEMPDVSLVLMV
jgi:hypothetical protein